MENPPNHIKIPVFIFPFETPFYIEYQGYKYPTIQSDYFSDGFYRLERYEDNPPIPPKQPYNTDIPIFKIDNQVFVTSYTKDADYFYLYYLYIYSHEFYYKILHRYDYDFSDFTMKYLHCDK